MASKDKNFGSRYVNKEEKSGRTRTRRVHTPGAGRGYKDELNKLFDKGEVSDRLKGVVGGLSDAAGEGADRQRLIREARAAEAQPEFNELIAQLHKTHRLPGDQDLMMRALDHPDEGLIEAALDTLLEMDGRRTLARRAVLKAKLNTLKQVAKSTGVLDMVELLEARL
jgi:hypothetical protein